MRSVRLRVSLFVLWVATVSSFGAEASPTSLTLEVSPTHGPAGSGITALSEGLGDCEGNAEEDPHLSVAWDGTVLPDVEQVPNGDGSVSLAFHVPGGASVGSHTVTAQCLPNREDDLQVTASFTVEAQPVEVPDLTGMTVDEARTRLGDAGLVLASQTGDGDHVTKQSPEPQIEAAPGAPVTVSLGTASPDKLFFVPDLTGLSLSRAEAQLAAVGLVLGPHSGSGDRVTGQDPLPHGQVDLGSVVSVSLQGTVAPPVTVTVPDLTGMSLADAAAGLGAVELVLGPASGDGDGITSQSPDPGSTVPVGSVVTVSLLGAVVPPALIHVPNLHGTTAEEAGALLDQVGLVLGPVTGHGTFVKRQKPFNGSLVPLQTQVSASLDRSAPAKLVIIPNLVGRSVEDAGASLQDAGLVLDGGRDPAQDRKVETQDPRAGVSVRPGEPVTVTPVRARFPHRSRVAGVALAVLVGGAGAAAYTRARSRHRHA